MIKKLQFYLYFNIVITFKQAMGNQNCSQIYNNSEQNQAYGDYKLLKINNKTVAIIEKTLENDQQLKNEVRQKLQVRLKLKSNHLIKLIKYQITSTKFSTNVQMQYDFIAKSLEDKYKQKLHLQIDFNQRQLFNIIYGVEDALLQLNKYQIRHGCINLTTILCQSNFYKITDVSSTTFVRSYDLVRRGCRNQFLSQKLLTNLQYRSLQPYYEIEDDFFSLGMIILTLTSKVDSQHYYHWKEKQCTAQIKWDNVENSIKKMERTYSSKLSKKVKQLIGFCQQIDKSLQTNSTTANHNHNITGNVQTNLTNTNSYGHSFRNKNDQISEISHTIIQLDRDIDQILSRVNVNSSINKKQIKDCVQNQKYEKSDLQIANFFSSENKRNIFNPHQASQNSINSFQKPNQEHSVWKQISFREKNK